VRGKVGGSGGDDSVARVIETGTNGVVDGVGADPGCGVEEGAKVPAGGVTYCIGIARSDRYPVVGWGE
jgi:hypothetical protein